MILSVFWLFSVAIVVDKVIFGMISSVLLAVLRSHRGRQGHLRESSHSSARDIDVKEIRVLY